MKIKLRWLVIEDEYKHWDDMAKEYDYTKYERRPILQYFDGKKWSEPSIVKKQRKNYS